MKRFYCTECKRVKRVRRLPTNVTTPAATDAADRIGSCDWHVTGRIQPQVFKVTKQKKAS